MNADSGSEGPLHQMAFGLCTEIISFQAEVPPASPISAEHWLSLATAEPREIWGFPRGIRRQGCGRAGDAARGWIPGFSSGLLRPWPASSVSPSCRLRTREAGTTRAPASWCHFEWEGRGMWRVEHSPWHTADCCQLRKGLVSILLLPTEGSAAVNVRSHGQE